MEELSIHINTAVITKLYNLPYTDMRSVISTAAVVAVFRAAADMQGIIDLRYQHACAKAAFGINAVRIFIPCSNTAAIIYKAAVAAEKLVVKFIVGTVIAAAVFIKYASAELAAVIELIGVAHACNNAPAVNFNVAVHIVFAAVAVYGGKGFNAVIAVTADGIKAVAD